VGAAEVDWNTKVAARVQQLLPPDAARFRDFEKRCQGVLAQQKAAGALTELDLQAEGLGRLTWIYLGLLNARPALLEIMKGGGGELSGKISRLETQLEHETDENLRQSLGSQLEILRQRAKTQDEGRTKIAFLEAELDRIDQQVELIREQALLAGDPGSVS